jgi:hypothetical protein
MKIFFIKLLVFSLLIWVVLKFLDGYYTSYTVANKNVCQKPDWVLAHSGQNFDMAFLGNSRVYYMLDVPYLEKQTGKRGINLGLTGSNYSEIFLLFYQFLKSNNTVKNLFLEVDLLALNAKKVDFLFHGYTYMHLLNDTVVSNVYKDNAPAYRYFLWKHVPFVRYMEYSNRFVFYKMIKGGFECKTFDELDQTKGGVFFQGQDFPKSYANNYWTIDPVDKKYFDKIIAYAREKNINVILYTAPIYPEYAKRQLNYDAVMQVVSELAEKENLPYLDFSRPDYHVCLDKSNFFDNTHLNKKGVGFFCEDFADSIKPLLK